MTSRPDRRRPQRTCVQCGAKGDKSGFRRIAGRPGEAWEPDPGTGVPGRGLYLCREGDCVEGFARRIRTRKGAARFRLGAHAASLADRLDADRGTISAAGPATVAARGRIERRGSKR